MDSEALLFITTAKVAFLGGVKFGTGLLVNRVHNSNGNSNSTASGGWSAPCAIGSFGFAFGAIAGVMVTDVIIPLKTADALSHFQKSFSFTLGGEAGFAFGPLGRNGAAEVDASSGGVSTAMSLSNSKGIYGGVTLDGSVIKVRHDINQKFYGQEHSVKEILDGTVPCPPAAQPLYDKLREYGEVLARRKAGGGSSSNRGNTGAHTRDGGSENDDGGGGGGLGQLWKSWTGSGTAAVAQQEGQQCEGGGGGSMSASYPAPGGSGYPGQQQQSGGGGQQSGAQQAYGVYQQATPEQRAYAFGAAKGAYDSATPEQRTYAFDAASSAAANAATATTHGPDDVFV